jgi:hypothetical protein
MADLLSTTLERNGTFAQADKRDWMSVYRLNFVPLSMFGFQNDVSSLFLGEISTSARVANITRCWLARLARKGERMRVLPAK